MSFVDGSKCLERLRHVLALLLLCCFCLPIAQCEFRDKDDPDSFAAASLGEAARPNDDGLGHRAVTVFIPVRESLSGSVFWLWLGLLGGPLMCVLSRRHLRRGRAVRVLAFIESGLEAYTVWTIARLGGGWPGVELRYGGWLALMALLSLLGITLYDHCRHIFLGGVHSIAKGVFYRS